MGKFNTYRYLELKDDTSSPHINPLRSRSLNQPRKLKKIFIFLIIGALCVTYFTGLFANQSRFLDGIAKSLGYQYVHHHAVIIDAGSSGSRVLAYKFRVPFTVFGQANLDLVEEFFFQSKPGLSSFADEPEKGAETIVQLIKKAEYLTPADKRKDTPLIVRATAGLRLLSPEKAEALIQAVRVAISKLGYQTDDESSVEIMDGADEGIFIWYTVNLLHDTMDGETMAALDLGGGSTQMTYQLSPELVNSVPRDDMYSVPTGAYNISVYTHSYLNLGLLAARYGILQLGVKDANDTEFTSVCVDPIIKSEPWVYANKKILVSGAARTPINNAKTYRQVSYKNCHALVKQYTMRHLSPVPRTPPGRVAAMSFFYDVAADAGVIDVMKGGSVTISQYKQAAEYACAASNIEQPWACVDLVYIVTLLQDAYQLPSKKHISLFKKVNGHEVSWALGLAYTTVMNRIAVTVN